MPGHNALGHMAAKLANVIYMCLKTMTLYDEAKHRIQMGLSVENGNKTSATIDAEDADQEPSELPDSSSNPPTVP